MAAKKSGIEKISQTIGILLLCLLMLTGFSVYVLPHFGWRVDGLRSGSMEPQLKTGDLIVTHSVAPETVALGNIITFHAPSNMANSLIAHRVVGIHENSPLSFETKGDANATPDPFLTPAREVVGKVSCDVPHCGYIVIFLKTTPGLLISLVAPGLLIIWICLENIREELAQQAQRKHGTEAQ